MLFGNATDVPRMMCKPVATDMAKKNLLDRRYDKSLFIYSNFVGITI